jgi:predicted RNA methylase
MLDTALIKNNTVPDVLSLLTYLKYDSNSLSENKNIFENIINKYYYYNAIVVEIFDEFKNNIKKDTMMRINNKKFINIFIFTAIR